MKKYNIYDKGVFATDYMVAGRIWGRGGSNPTLILATPRQFKIIFV
jgi:hypothetical protein